MERSSAAISSLWVTNTVSVRTFTVSEPQNLVSLMVFVAVSATVSVLVDRSARRSSEALRARAEAEALARTTATLVGEADPLAGVLAQVRAVFDFTAASVLSRHDGGWLVEAAAGQPVPTEPGAGVAFALHPDESTMLVVVGERMAGDDRRVKKAGFTPCFDLVVADQRSTDVARDR